MPPARTVLDRHTLPFVVFLIGLGVSALLSEWARRDAGPIAISLSISGLGLLWLEIASRLERQGEVGHRRAYAAWFDLLGVLVWTLGGLLMLKSAIDAGGGERTASGMYLVAVLGLAAYGVLTDRERVSQMALGVIVVVTVPALTSLGGVTITGLTLMVLMHRHWTRMQGMLDRLLGDR